MPRLEPAARLTLIVFWVVRGAFTLLYPQETTVFLLQLSPSSSQLEAGLVTNLLAATQCAVAVAFAMPRTARLASAAGFTMSAAMLGVVAASLPRLHGVRCGCLELLGVSQFGIANVAVLVSSALGFGLCFHARTRQRTRAVGGADPASDR